MWFSWIIIMHKIKAIICCKTKTISFYTIRNIILINRYRINKSWYFNNFSSTIITRCITNKIRFSCFSYCKCITAYWCNCNKNNCFIYTIYFLNSSIYSHKIKAIICCKIKTISCGCVPTVFEKIAIWLTDLVISLICLTLKLSLLIK